MLTPAAWKPHLLPSQDLLQRGVFSQGTLPPSCHSCWVLATAKEFCTAVAYLHSMDVVHGDLKSSNVLLKAAGVTPWDSRGFVAKVCRFGDLLLHLIFELVDLIKQFFINAAGASSRTHLRA